MNEIKGKKILLLGGSSFVGRNLADYIGKERIVSTFFKKNLPNGLFFDITKMDVAEILNKYKNIHSAIILISESNHEKCKNEPNIAKAINITCLKKLIQQLIKRRIKPIFISTQLVFDGHKGNYIENDKPRPIINYAKQKLEIENFLLQNCKNCLIFRLSKICGDRFEDNTLFSNFAKDILANNKIKCATNQTFAPVLAYEAAKAITTAMEKNLEGIFHIGGPESITRIECLYLLLKKIKKIVNVDPKIIPCDIDDFGNSELQPKNTSLISKKITKFTNVVFSSPDVICDRLIKDINFQMNR